MKIKCKKLYHSQGDKSELTKDSRESENEKGQCVREYTVCVCVYF